MNLLLTGVSDVYVGLLENGDWLVCAIEGCVRISLSHVWSNQTPGCCIHFRLSPSSIYRLSLRQLSACRTFRQRVRRIRRRRGVAVWRHRGVTSCCGWQRPSSVVYPDLHDDELECCSRQVLRQGQSRWLRQRKFSLGRISCFNNVTSHYQWMDELIDWLIDWLSK